MSRALLIAGTQSNVGKTTVTMGLLAALSKKLRVQAYKSGPDYIDPAFHTFITGRKSRNLDNYLMSNETVKELFLKHLDGVDLGVIEGAMGLYDGSLEDPEIGSAASISKIIQCPVVLVVDGSGMSMSAAALVKGYCDFDSEVPLKGVIFNRVNSIGHYELLKSAVETHTGVKAYGYLPDNLPTIPSRHLGLVASCEIEDLREKVEMMGSNFEKTVDIEGLIELATSHRSFPFRGIRIGVAYDEAFNFYYEDNLELLREQGAEILYFSPLRDRSLPEDLHFLYFGGGYPEQYAQILSDNVEMKKAVLEKLEAGIPYLAECGGLMYLCSKLVDFDGTCHEMLGWLSGVTRMTKSLKRFGYKTLKLKENCILGKAGTEIKIHEFHHSELENLIDDPVYELKIYQKDQDPKIETCGYRKGNGVAGYPHFHFYSNQTMAIHLLKAAAQYKDATQFNARN